MNTTNGSHGTDDFEGNPDMQDEIDDEEFSLEGPSHLEQCAEMLCLTYSRNAQGEKHLFSWGDISAEIICEPLSYEKMWGELVRDLGGQLQGHIDILENTIKGYWLAESCWAPLAVNCYLEGLLDNEEGAKTYYSLDIFLTEWLENGDAKLRHDLKTVPMLDSMIYHESTRLLNTMRVKAGMEVFL